MTSHAGPVAGTLTEALLVLGRTDQWSFVSAEVDLSPMAEEATETQLALAETRGVVLEASGEVELASGSAALLQQWTTNLVHNAIVHTAEPRSGVGDHVAGARCGAVTLTVENTSVVLIGGVVATLVEPFQRGAERVRTDHAGRRVRLGNRRQLSRGDRPSTPCRRNNLVHRWCRWLAAMDASSNSRTKPAGGKHEGCGVNHWPSAALRACLPCSHGRAPRALLQSQRSP